MKTMVTIIPLVCLYTFGAITGMAQSLTSKFQFTGSGLIGTPATATTPFQGKTFSNTPITITTVGNIEHRTFDGGSCYELPSTSASVSIQGIGTYQFVATRLLSCANVDPVKGVTGNILYLQIARPQQTQLIYSPVATAIPSTTAWDMSRSFGPYQTHINTQTDPMATDGGVLQFTGELGLPGSFVSV